MSSRDSRARSRFVSSVLAVACVGGAVGAAAAGAGQLTFGSVLLHNSRAAESQADVMGTQVLYDSGFDPRAMAAFFENLNASSEGKAPPEFFSDHPNPDHRIERVEAEIRKMGGAPEGAEKDSPEFEAIKREVAALPPPPKGKPTSPDHSGASGARAPANVPKPEAPSSDIDQVRYAKATLSYPANWRKYAKKNDVILVPVGGVIDSGNGQGALAWGMIAGVSKLKDKNVSADTFRANTQKLLDSLQKENEAMVIDQGPSDFTVGGRPALSTLLHNDSPAGGTEKDWVVTVIGPQGLYYYIFVAPESDYGRFRPAYQSILESIQFQK